LKKFVDSCGEPKFSNPLVVYLLVPFNAAADQPNACKMQLVGLIFHMHGCTSTKELELLLGYSQYGLHNDEGLQDAHTNVPMIDGPRIAN
jgi:hypothetical protein